MSQELPFVVRLGRPSDWPYITSSWITSTFQDRTCTWKEAKAEVRATLADPSTEVLVAHVPSDDDAILGWVVLNPTTPEVHYIYVRSTARLFGIARSLLAGIGE